jgi:hypothetical protein
LFLSLILANCNPSPENTATAIDDTTINTPTETTLTDAEAVAADSSTLEILYNGSESSSAVTTNLTLPSTGPNGSTITWSSDTTLVIADDGTVTRPAYGSGNATVTMTATVTVGLESQTVTFTITVLESGPPAGTQYALSAGGINVNMRYVSGKTTFTGTYDTTQATVASGYLIAETEVTYELWSTVYTWATAGDGGTVHIGEASYTFANAGVMGDGIGDASLHPVTTINWRDSMVWCNALTEYYNAQNGTSLAVVYTSDAAYTTPIRVSTNSTTISWDAGSTYSGTEDEPYVNPNARGFRLPTRNEWELAARYIDDANGDGDIMDSGDYYPGSHFSGDTSNPYFSSTIRDDYGWYSGNSGSSTQVVATKTANALGLVDMSGNVGEWVFDWYTVGSYREYRGGGWLYTAMFLQVGYVDYNSPYYENDDIGFRPVRNP